MKRPPQTGRSSAAGKSGGTGKSAGKGRNTANGGKSTGRTREVSSDGTPQPRNKKGRIPEMDQPFLITLLIIVGFGLVMVFSASMYTSVNSGDSGYSSFFKQSLFALLGICVMWFISRINYKVFNDFKLMKTAMWIVAGLLALVLIPGIGIKVNDARRWLGYGSLTFQPSELAKIVGIMYLASLAATQPEKLENWKDLILYVFLPMAVICGLTALEPSLSAAMAIGVGMMAVLWFGMLKNKFIVPVIGAAAAGVAALVLTSSWRMERLLAMLSKSNVNYQIRQSLVAFGSGGLFGVGLGNGKQKLLFLPEVSNDFIFANIGEELGLVGCLLVLGLYCYLIYRGYKIAFACKNKFGRLYTASVMTLLGFQVFVNIGVAINALPVTGMALPFISAGGTSIVVLFAMMGPIMNISRQVRIPGRSRKRIRLMTVGQKKQRRRKRQPARGEQ